MDLTVKSNITIWVKGSGNELRISFESDTHGDEDYYGITIWGTLSTWTCYTLYFSDFRQRGFGSSVPLETSLQQVTAIRFEACSKISGEHGFFRLDDIKLKDFGKGNDTKKPGSVTGFTVKTNDPDALVLTWENPLDLDWAGTAIYRTTKAPVAWVDYSDDDFDNEVDTNEAFFSTFGYDPPSELVDIVSGTHITVYTDSQLNSKDTYYYFVKTFDCNGNTNLLDSVNEHYARGKGTPVDTVPPSAPAFTSISMGAFSNVLVLQWQNPSDHDIVNVIVIL